VNPIFSRECRTPLFLSKIHLALHFYELICNVLELLARPGPLYLSRKLLELANEFRRR
jgi:hypothetical protein